MIRTRWWRLRVTAFKEGKWSKHSAPKWGCRSHGSFYISGFSFCIYIYLYLYIYIIIFTYFYLYLYKLNHKPTMNQPRLGKHVSSWRCQVKRYLLFELVAVLSINSIHISGKIGEVPKKSEIPRLNDFFWESKSSGHSISDILHILNLMRWPGEAPSPDID